MKLVVNGRPAEFPDGTTIAHAVTDVTGTDQGRGIAVAVNGVVVTRSDWSSTLLGDGDSVEILTATQGG